MPRRLYVPLYSGADFHTVAFMSQSSLYEEQSYSQLTRAM